MLQDEVVEEIHKIRKKYSWSFNNWYFNEERDCKAIFLLWGFPEIKF